MKMYTFVVFVFIIFILDWNKISAEDVDFDEKKWDMLIDPGEDFTDQFSKTLLKINTSNVKINKKDIVKLSASNFKKSTFFNSEKLIRTGRKITILIPPSTYQRVRYENECEKILRYLSVPNKRTLTVEVNKELLFTKMLSYCDRIDP